MDPNEISRQTGTGVLHCLLCVYVDFDLDVFAGCRVLDASWNHLSKFKSSFTVLLESTCTRSLAHGCALCTANDGRIHPVI